jgi:hypothetical protein
MSDQRIDIVADFNARAYRDLEAMNTLKQVLEGNPTAIMIVWEAEGDLKIATLPKSLSLARGMTEIAYGIMWPDPEEKED